MKKGYTEELKKLLDDLEPNIESLMKNIPKKSGFETFMDEERAAAQKEGPKAMAAIDAFEKHFEDVAGRFEECVKDEADRFSKAKEVCEGPPTRKELMSAYAELDAAERRLHAECLADVRAEFDGIRTDFKTVGKGADRLQPNSWPLRSCWPVEYVDIKVAAASKNDTALSESNNVYGPDGSLAAVGHPMSARVSGKMPGRLPESGYVMGAIQTPIVPGKNMLMAKLIDDDANQKNVWLGCYSESGQPTKESAAEPMESAVLCVGSKKKPDVAAQIDEIVKALNGGPKPLPEPKAMAANLYCRHLSAQFFDAVPAFKDRPAVNTTENVVYISLRVVGADNITAAVLSVAGAARTMDRNYGIEGFLATCGCVELADRDALRASGVSQAVIDKYPEGKQFVIYSFARIAGGAADVHRAQQSLKNSGFGGTEGSIGELLPV